MRTTQAQYPPPAAAAGVVAGGCVTRTHVCDGGTQSTALCGSPAGVPVAQHGDVNCVICLAALDYCTRILDKFGPLTAGGQR